MKPHFRLQFLLIFIVLLMIVPFQGIVFADDHNQQAVFGSPKLVVNTSFLNIRTGPSASYGILATVPGGTELPVIAVYEDGVWYQVATNIGLGWVNVEFTLARGEFSNVPLIQYGEFSVVSQQPVVSVANLGQGGGAVIPTTTATGNVGVSFIGGDLRTGPGSDAFVVVALAPPNDNEVFPISNAINVDGRPYYQVNHPIYGLVWSDRFRVRPLQCNGLSVLVAKETAGTVAVGTSNPISFEVGDEMFVAGPGRDGLIEIVTPDGTRGLIPVDKVRPSEAVYFCDGVASSAGAPTSVVTTTANLGQGGGVVTTTAPITSGARLVVNTGNLNIRTGPSASYGILATVPGGTELPVTAVYEDGVWYQVATNLGLGWVNIEFTLARGEFSNVPLIQYGSINAASVYQNNSVAIVVQPAANLGQGGGVVTTASVTGNSGVVTGVSFIGGDLRTAPGSDAFVVVALAPPNDNEVFPILNAVDVDGRPYYQVNHPIYGLVWSDRFRVRPLQCNGLSVLVAKEPVGTVAIGNSNPISFNDGDEMYVAGPGRDGLIEIVTPDGTRGLIPVDKVRPSEAVYFCDGVASSAGAPTSVVTTTANLGQGGGVVTTTAPITSGARLVVNTGNLNIRTGPSASYGILATVPGGTELPVTAVYEDGVWYQVATNLGLGWVNIEFTLARGEFSNVPLIQYGSINAASVYQNNSVAIVAPSGGTVTSAARVIVNTPNLNIRTGPSASFSIVATVSGATELAVLGVADDGVWYLVEGTFGRGWLNNEFVIFRGDYSAVPVLNINP